MLNHLNRINWIRLFIWYSTILCTAYFLSIGYIYIDSSTTDEQSWNALSSTIGFITYSIFVLLLYLSPINSFFPNFTTVKRLIPIKRDLGISVFILTATHFIIVVASCFAEHGYFPVAALILHPIIASGFISFIIFTALAMTSNSISMQLLGWIKWKKLHKTVYIAQALIIIHVLFQGTIGGYIIIFTMIPLIFFQYMRFSHKSTT